MNIFYLHHLPQVAARFHCDKHIGKMLIESCQMLATAHHHHGNGHAVSYKSTHANHPSSIWVRESCLHYNWLVSLARELGREFYKRYGKHHKSYDVLIFELFNAPPAMRQLPLKWRPPTLAMPDEFKSDDHIESYRRFYATKRDRMDMVYYRHLAPAPDWLTDIWNETEVTA
jgi:hypothetical protein